MFQAQLLEELRSYKCKNNNECPLAAHCHAEFGICHPNQAQQCTTARKRYCTTTTSRSYACVAINGSFQKLSGMPCAANEQCSWGNCHQKCKQPQDCTNGKACIKGLCQTTSSTKVVSRNPYADTTINHHTPTSDGSIVLAGYRKDPTKVGSFVLQRPNEPQSFIAKVDTKGTTLWLIDFKSQSSAFIRKVLADKTGNIYLTGRFMHALTLGKKTLKATGSYDIFVAKITSNGEVLWLKQFGTESDDSNSSLTITKTGIHFVVSSYKPLSIEGKTYGNTTMSSNTLISLNHQGKFLQAKSFPAKSIMHETQLSSDPSGNIYVAAQFINDLYIENELIRPTSKGSTLLMKLDSKNSVVWKKILASSNYSSPSKLLTNKYGESFLLGYFRQELVIENQQFKAGKMGSGYLMKVTSAGSLDWVNITESEHVHRVSQAYLDENQQIVLAGTFNQQLRFLSKQFISSAEITFFALGVSRNGMVSWSIAQDKKRGDTDPYPRSLSFSPKKNLLMATNGGNMWHIYVP